MSTTHVYLVPGFFGFTSLGSLNYFHRVSDTLGEALRRRGVSARVVECATRPTASIRRRADRLLQDVIDTGGLEADSVHFVGHSTGGLDIRLLTTPGVRLRDGASEEVLARRTRSVISLATPHYGTPIANFFTTLSGRHLLEILTVLATTRGGRYAVYGAAMLLQLVARLDDAIGRDRTFLDNLAQRLLCRISMEDDDPMFHFLREVSSDQGAIIQLTPESMHLFNAAVTDRQGLRYSSVLTAAPPPPAVFLKERIRSLPVAASAGAFALLWTLAGREHAHYPYPHPGEGVLEAFEPAAHFDMTPRTNDGIVPTLSQVYGNVLGLVVADHLDVVGQYPFAQGDPHSDWLPSGSRFGDTDFAFTWDLVADEIAASL